MEISNDNEIAMFFHCALCLDEKPNHISPRDFSDLEAGWTKQGFQVWCKRHDCNIIHMDFKGHKHPANTDRKPKLVIVK